MTPQAAALVFYTVVMFSLGFFFGKMWRGK